MKHIYTFRQVLFASLLFLTQMAIGQGGVLDQTTFGTGTSGGLNFISNTAITSTNKILIAGSFTSYDGNTKQYIAQINADGTFDGNFNSGGLGTNLIVRALKIRSDNKIWIGGPFFQYNGAAVPGGIILLNEDGTRDVSYNPTTGTNLQVNSIDILPSSGDIIAGGLFTSFNGTMGIGKLARISATGVLDATFNTNIGTGAGGGDIENVLVQPDEKIIVVGGFTTWNGAAAGRIVRLNSDGTLDGTFNTNIGTAAGGTINSVALRTDNTILVGGIFTTWNGTTGINRLVNLDTDGNRIVSFTAGAGGLIATIKVKSDNSFLIGGQFGVAGTTTPSNLPTRNSIGAFTAAGLVDGNFVPNPGATASSFVNDIEIQSDGNIVMVGSFTTVNGTSRSRIARLYGDLNPAMTAQVSTITTISANNVYALGSTSGTIVAKVVPNGGTPVSGNVTVNLTLDGTAQYIGNIPFVRRRYEINPGAGSTARVTLYYTQADFDDFNTKYNGDDLPYNGADVEGNKANIRFTKFSGTSTGGTGNPADFVPGVQTLIDPVDSDIIWNANTSKWEVTFDVSGFSGFFMQTNPLLLLPVNLKTFTAAAVQGGAKLNWTTASEQNSSHFVVERSVDGTNYRSAGRVNAAGNSQTTRNYSLVDDLSKVPHGGIIYYRLYMVDKDGTGLYSKVQTVKPGKSNAGAALLTNPVGAEARILYQANVGEKVTLRLLDSRGQLVSQRQEQVAAGSNQIRIATANLAKGIYMLEVTGNGERNTIRLVKE